MHSTKLDTKSGKVTCGKSEEINQNSSYEDRGWRDTEKVQYEFPFYNVLNALWKSNFKERRAQIEMLNHQGTWEGSLEVCIASI